VRRTSRIGGEHGFTGIIDQTDGDPQRELELINQSDHGTLFDGVIVSPLGLTARDADAISSERPVVFLGEETHPGFDHAPGFDLGDFKDPPFRRFYRAGHGTRTRNLRFTRAVRYQLRQAGRRRTDRLATPS
jgi:DNA-binding LacI/PurR family transcriptional regulator